MAGLGEAGVEDADKNKHKFKPDGKPPRSWCSLVFKMFQDCVLLVTVLYSVIGVISNASVSKERASPPPARFFHKNSLVEDYWRGNVFRAFQDATQFENSFMMYYAAWDADSQEARSTMEAVAEFFADSDILVAAVNCWYPTSQCAKEFGTKGHSHHFPVFIFYPRELKGLQYRGPVTPEYVIAFIRNCRYPLQHLRDKDHLEQLQTHHSSVLLGFTPSTSHTASHHNYRHLHQVSLSLLEYDPHRELAVAAVTSPTLARQLHLHISQPVRLLTWNATQVYPNKTIDQDKLLNWAVKADSRPITWLNLPGKKSLVLQQSLSSGSGSSLLVFTPRNPVLPNNVFNSLRSIAASYNNCNNTDIVNESITRLDQQDEVVDCDMVTTCRMSSWSYDGHQEASPACHLVKKHNASCHSKDSSSSITPVSFDENINILADEQFREEFHVRVMKRSARDHQTFPSHSVSPVSVRGQGCESNRSLTMFALDAARYGTFLNSLGLASLPLPVSVIVNVKEESLFLPPPENQQTLSFKDGLAQFIASWHQHSVSATPGRRSSDVSATPSEVSATPGEMSGVPGGMASGDRTDPQRSLMTEVNAEMFLSAVTEKDQDVVLFYTSSYCSACTTVSYVLHAVATYFSDLETVKFVMIDASKNDLPWQYTTLSFPTVIVFPKNRSASSRVFPSHKSLSITNLLSFVVSNVAPEVRLWLALKHCDQACLAKTRVSATKTVSNFLSLARRRPWSSARPDIANKLRFAKTLLYVLAAWEADKTKSPNVSRQYFRAILDSFSLSRR